jgi:hypothetical protein
MLAVAAFHAILNSRMGRYLCSFIFITSLLAQSHVADPKPATDANDALPPLTCPAGAPLGNIELKVKSGSIAETLPLQQINHLSEGDTVLYSPVLRGQEKRPGEVSLVLVPASRAPDSGPLEVTEPARANRAHEWAIPRTMNLAAFVYGPQGLSKKKVRGFLSQDDQLVAQLADYAEKTSETEALLQALSDNAASPASMNAALSGFASQYGLAVQIDKNAPPAAQAQVLFGTMNPQLASYNPLASDSNAQRLGETASVAAAAATLFFGSPIGLAAGGTAMLLDLRSIAFPGTQFRSSFAQPARKGVHLCGQRGNLPPHTRLAYIWAMRIPNTPDPVIRIGKADNLPLGQKTPVAVEAGNVDWKYLQRAREWELEDEHGKRTPIKVLKIGNQRELEIDLQKVAVAAGDYKLMGHWDWSPFYAGGSLHLRRLSDFKSAALDPQSQNALLAHAGKVAVTLRGSDFEFTNKVELQKAGDEFATPEPVRFKLPKGPRLGPQESMDVQIDTASLNAGDYTLLITQQDGASHSVGVHVLSPVPRFDNLPILVNEGATAQHYVLKGEGLNLLAKLTAPNAAIELGSSSLGGRERDVVVRLAADASIKSVPGTALPVEATLVDRSAKLSLNDALQTTGPLPVIASSQLSAPPDIEIALHPNEFPAGYTLTAVLDVRNIDPKSELHLACAEDVGAQAALHLGSKDAISSLQRLSPDQLFVSYDTSGFPAGCTLQAWLDNGRAGRSQAFTVAHLIRLPRIVSLAPLGNPAAADSLALAGAPVPPGGAAPAALQAFEITGDNLEMISQVGWDRNIGIAVAGLPAAIPGQGQRQTLAVNLPPPPNPGAPLYLWLRGETASRATTVTLAPAGSISTHADSVAPVFEQPSPPRQGGALFGLLGMVYILGQLLDETA